MVHKRQTPVGFVSTYACRLQPGDAVVYPGANVAVRVDGIQHISGIITGMRTIVQFDYDGNKWMEVLADDQPFIRKVRDK